MGVTGIARQLTAPGRQRMLRAMHSPPLRLWSGDDPEPVLQLIRSAFAAMDGRIDPPSSMHRLTSEDIRLQAREGEVWLIGPGPLACVFLTPVPAADGSANGSGVMRIGKLATATQARRQGLARALIELAAARARLAGFGALELQSRVELTENHLAFVAMGFTKTGETAHPGYDRSTSFTFRRLL